MTSLPKTARVFGSTCLHGFAASHRYVRSAICDVLLETLERFRSHIQQIVDTRQNCYGKYARAK
ncbi:MAG: hypothetical protein QM784_01195 [Polyangiaceae bacterium]